MGKFPIKWDEKYRDKNTYVCVCVCLETKIIHMQNKLQLTGKP